MTKALIFPRQRRHTLFFLDEATKFRPVYLDIEVDMSNIQTHRSQSVDKPSYIAYLIQIMAGVISRFPEANTMITGGLTPRLVRLPNINAKFTLDKSLEGQRLVVSAVIADADQASLQQIQERLHYFKQNDITDCPEFAPLLRLHKLPFWLGRWMFARAMKKPASKSSLQGSFTITSLGHLPIIRFAPMVGSTLSLGVGAITERAVVKAGQLAIRPILNLTMSFDHRVLDGAISAEILTAIKTALEGYSTDTILINTHQEQLS